MNMFMVFMGLFVDSEGFEQQTMGRFMAIDV
jgi:hypothetical protein